MSKLPVTEAELHAYVDGLLPEERRAEVEAYLDACPEVAERLRTYRAQNEALRTLFEPVLDEPLPARLLPQRRRRAWRLPRYAAILAWICIGGAAGWMLRGALLAPANEPPVSAQRGLAASLPRQAAIAHAVYSPDVRRPVEIGADQEEQLVAWLSKRLGAQLRPPQLGALGYELIGGRLLPGSAGPVAQFMYQDASGQRLTLYVVSEHDGHQDTAFRFAQEGPVNVFYWIDGKFGYALSAGIDKGQLARVAEAVYDQLSPK
ncbi:MAG TPA: anti-sigma factor [Candidatus Competibacteraceae bacterium]|nr:anti-sigma factor [Candidatus Competibacteraceae bacterium]